MANSQIKSVLGIVFTETRDSVLLIKRRDVPVWVLPGGGIELGETPEEAVLREIFEETHMKASILRKVGTYSPPKLGLFQKPTLIYECHIKSGTFTPNEEVKETAFFPVNNLPKKTPPPFIEFIQDALPLNASPFEKTIQSVTFFKLLYHFSSHPILAGRFLLSRLGLHFNT